MNKEHPRVLYPSSLESAIASLELMPDAVFLFGDVGSTFPAIDLSGISELDFLFEDHSGIYFGLSSKTSEVIHYLEDRNRDMLALFTDLEIQHIPALLGGLFFPHPLFTSIPASWAGSLVRFLGREANHDIELRSLARYDDYNGIPAMIIAPKH